MSEDWRPVASCGALRARAAMLAGIRAFFSQRDVLEVETPLVSRASTTDPALESLEIRAADAPRFLHTSPEFPMKRLLAAGSGDIYQIARVFRAGEAGRLHNPEFTMLEWYRLGFDASRLMDEVEALVRELAGAADPGPAERLTYKAVFERHAGIDPLRADVAQLSACAGRHGIDLAGSPARIVHHPSAAAADPLGPSQRRLDALATNSGEICGLDRDGWLDLLMSAVVAPALPAGRLTFIRDYPASQAALARLRPGDPPVAERFELFWGSLELANGFHELTDAGEQAARFDRDLERREAAGLPSVPVDTRLLAALESGLPDCAGVALGVDRLLMCVTGATRIDEVLAFGWNNA